MKLLFAYLKVHIKYIILFFAFAAVCAVVSYLYNLPTEAVLYSFFLCLLLSAIAGAAGFYRFKKRCEIMTLLIKNAGEIEPVCPEPRNRIEEDYTGLINALNSKAKSVYDEKNAALRDMSDYYTLWVHQIKNPIAAMHLLLQKNPDGELSEQLFRIEQYTEMVLTYVRCSDSSSDLVLESYELDDIIKAAVRKYAKSFIRKKLTLSFDETHLRVLTDAKWLQFVIEQIISNSVKYTVTGGVSIYAEGGTRLIIEDTGVGISHEDLPRIFEKGFTGYNGREDKKSTGIGLYLVKKILDKLGHSVTVSSLCGEGTRVVIAFDLPEIKYE